jgi:glycosidase
MNVADQRADPDSVLHFVRDVIAFRRRSSHLLSGDYLSPPIHDGLWVFQRGGTLVALNLSPEPRELTVGGTSPRTVALSTHRASEGPVTGEVLGLEAWQGVVVTSRG